MKYKYLKIVSLSLSLTVLGMMTSCQEDDDLKRQLQELELRVSNIENQLSEIDESVSELHEQGKLNAEEVKALKELTDDLTAVMGNIKNDNTSQTNEINGLSEDIAKLKTSIENTITVVQFDDLKATVNQLNTLIEDNYLEQQLTEERVGKLNDMIAQIAADLEKLKAWDGGAELDRPINVQASKGTFGNRIVVTWTPMPMAENYQLFKFNENSGAYEMVQEGADTVFIDLSPVDPYKKVFYKVKIVNNSNEFSEFSDVVFGYTSGKNYSKYLSFGYEGDKPGLLGLVLYISVDASNNIYLSDEYNHWVQKFDREGNFLEIFYDPGNSPRGTAFLKNGNAVVTSTQTSTYVKILDASKKIVTQWGSYGTGNRQFQNIEEITVDDEDNLYIIDGISNSVKKFDANGNFLLKFTAAVRTEDQTDGPYPKGICYFNNKIFVTSSRNGIVRAFDKNGKFLYSWDAGVPCNSITSYENHLYIASSNFIMKTDENGSVREKIGEEELSDAYLYGIAVNQDGEIIVSSPYKRKIIVFKEL